VLPKPVVRANGHTSAPAASENRSQPTTDSVPRGERIKPYAALPRRQQELERVRSGHGLALPSGRCEHRAEASVRIVLVSIAIRQQQCRCSETTVHESMSIWRRLT
jgi:hypothetical protein